MHKIKCQCIKNEYYALSVKKTKIFIFCHFFNNFAKYEIKVRLYSSKECVYAINRR
jgi:hypothetical protein